MFQFIIDNPQKFITIAIAIKNYVDNCKIRLTYIMEITNDWKVYVNKNAISILPFPDTSASLQEVRTLVEEADL